MANEYIVNYSLTCFRNNLKDTSSHVFINPSGIISIQKFWIFSRSFIAQHVWRKFSNSRCSDYWKIHLLVKNLKSSDFQLCPSRQVRILTQVLIIIRVKWPIPKAVCFQKSNPSSGKVGGRGKETMWWVK